MHDLVIRGGTIVDGTGAPRSEGDVAIDGDRIARVGGTAGPGRNEIDARGKLVAPGWVDIHTHYDGQVTWDPYVTPSSWHGVTTIVMGNCGVGFAPAQPERHDWLIGLMEGVEDIPGTALAEGIQWGWESFPEYLDALARMPRALDVAAQVPHGAVRAYVMGERGARNEPATADDIAAMGAIVRDGIAAGALGFTSSRTILHRAKDGEVVPGTYAGEDELIGIAQAMRRARPAIVEVASDLRPEDSELGWMERLSRETGCPVTFALLQNDLDPEQWRRMLAATDAAIARGASIRPQIAARPTGILLSLESLIHPLSSYPTYRAIADLPLAERVARLRDPAVRAALVAEEPVFDNPILAFISQGFHKLFPLGSPPDYEPAPERSLLATAERSGKRPVEIAYDLLLEDEGRAFLYFPFLNYAATNLDHVYEMMRHPQTVLGLSDGGAHCGVICDAGMPTFLLTHWARDRRRGERLPLEALVHGQTRRTAALYGLRDRGVLARGYLADVNVIDFDALALAQPQTVYDLPASARRLVQRAVGYRATIKSGQVIFEDGTPTGALPGSLVRGPQTAPA